MVNVDDTLNMEDDELDDIDVFEDDLLDDFDEDEEDSEDMLEDDGGTEDDDLGLDDMDDMDFSDFDGGFSDFEYNLGSSDLAENEEEMGNLSDNSSDMGIGEKGKSQNEGESEEVSAVEKLRNSVDNSVRDFLLNGDTQNGVSDKVVKENYKNEVPYENSEPFDILDDFVGDTEDELLDDVDLDLDEDTDDFDDMGLTEEDFNLGDTENTLSDEESTIGDSNNDLEDNDINGTEITELDTDTQYEGLSGPRRDSNTEVDEENFEIVYVEFSNIAIPSVRIRTDRNVEALHKSISSTGLLRPIEVATSEIDGVYILVDGYKRIVACARAGFKKIPCLINKSIKSSNIPILEALHNQHSAYTIEEQIKYIDYLEKERGIMSASMIEALLQMNSGDYAKLKDILEDNDDEIVAKLYEGSYDIGSAYRALEKRRKGESKKEKEMKQTAKMYADENSDIINDSGETSSGVELTEEELSEIAVNPSELDNGIEDTELEDMVAEGDSIKGFEKHKQDVNKREYIDPSIKKAVLARDNYTCQACKRGGEAYVDVLDFHHILPVFLGGVDSKDNGICLCLTCHKMVHLYSFGDLSIPAKKTEEELEKLDEESRILYEDERMKYKRIVKLGTVIRKGMETKNIKKEQMKKEHPIDRVGRRVPGGEQEAY